MNTEISTIVVGYLPTAEGIAALDHAKRWAADSSARLIVVNTGHHGDYAHPAFATSQDMDAIKAELEEGGVAHELLRPGRETRGRGDPRSGLHPPGRPDRHRTTAALPRGQAAHGQHGPARPARCAVRRPHREGVDRTLTERLSPRQSASPTDGPAARRPARPRRRADRLPGRRRRGSPPARPRTSVHVPTTTPPETTSWAPRLTTARWAGGDNLGIGGTRPQHPLVVRRQQPDAGCGGRPGELLDVVTVHQPRLTLHVDLGQPVAQTLEPAADQRAAWPETRAEPVVQVVRRGRPVGADVGLTARGPASSSSGRPGQRSTASRRWKVARSPRDGPKHRSPCQAIGLISVSLPSSIALRRWRNLFRRANAAASWAWSAGRRPAARRTQPAGPASRRLQVVVAPPARALPHPAARAHGKVHPTLFRREQVRRAAARRS